MRIALAAILLAHGFAHLVGFLGAWRPGVLSAATNPNLLFGGRIDLGSAGGRVLGLLWLVTAVGFWVVAVTTLSIHPWWQPLALGVCLTSLALCILQWPASRIGVPVNLVIIAAILLGGQLRWLPATA